MERNKINITPINLHTPTKTNFKSNINPDFREISESYYPDCTYIDKISIDSKKNSIDSKDISQIRKIEMFIKSLLGEIVKSPEGSENIETIEGMRGYTLYKAKDDDGLNYRVSVAPGGENVYRTDAWMYNNEYSIKAYDYTGNGTIDQYSILEKQSEPIVQREYTDTNQDGIIDENDEHTEIIFDI